MRTGKIAILAVTVLATALFGSAAYCFLGGADPSRNMGNYHSFSFYSDRPGNAAASWMQPGTAPPSPWDEFWFDNSGNFNLSAGLKTPGPLNTGDAYFTANSLAQLTADANFNGTVHLTAPVTLTANLTVTCNLKIEQGCPITTTGHTLTLPASFDNGAYQCFAGTGTVRFAKTPKSGYLPEWWGGVGDAYVTKPWAGITSGLTTLTVGSGGFAGYNARTGFTSDDVGKTVVVQGAGTSAGPLISTIVSVQSSTSVTLADPAVTTVSGKFCLYGHNDTDALNAAVTAAESTTGKVVLNGLGYITTTGLSISSAILLKGNLTSGNSDSSGGIMLSAVGAKIYYLGSGTGIYIDGGSTRLCSGTILQNIAIVNGGNGLIGIDIDGTDYDEKLIDVDTVGTIAGQNVGQSWATCDIRVGQTGRLGDLTFDHVNSSYSVVGWELLGVNDFTAFFPSLENASSECVLIGNSSKPAVSVKFYGGHIESGTESGNVVQIYNGRGVSFDGVYSETDGGHLIYVSASSTAATITWSGGTLCMNGGTVQPFYLGIKNGYGADLTVDGLYIYSPGTGAYLINNTESRSIRLNGVISPSAFAGLATGSTADITIGQECNLGGTIYPPTLPFANFGPYYSAAGTALPAAAVNYAGSFACVSDSTACTSGTTYTSGGTTKCLVQCNSAGTAWIETGIPCF